MVITFLTMYNKNQSFFNTKELKESKSKYFTANKSIIENIADIQ